MKLLTIVFGVTAFGLTFSSSDAYAARIPVIYQTGEEIFNVGELPSDLREELKESGKKIELGYKCNRFRLFFADVWTWNCSLVLYDLNSITSRSFTYYDIPASVKDKLNEEKYPKSMAKRGFWNRFGIFILLAAIVVFIIVGSRTGKSSSSSQSSENQGDGTVGGTTGNPSDPNATSSNQPPAH